MKTHHVKIRVLDSSSHKAEVAIDGVEVPSLEAVELRLDVHQPNRVVFHHIAPSVEFDGLAEVVHVPRTLVERVDLALERLKSLRGVLRIPADPADPDLVLSDVQCMLAAARQVEVGAAKHGWLSAGRLEQLYKLEGIDMRDGVTLTELRALIGEVRQARLDAVPG